MKYLKNYLFFKEGTVAPVAPVTPPTTGSQTNTQSDDGNKQEDKLNDQNKQVDTEYLKSIQNYIKDFNAKKSTLDQIFQNSKNDTDINKQIETKIYGNQKDAKKRNPYLMDYESILRLQKEYDTTSKAIKDYENDIQSRNNFINQSKERLADETDNTQKTNMASQAEKNKKDLADKEKQMTDVKKNLPLLLKDLNKKKADFKIKMKNDESRIKTLLTNNK